MNSKIILTDKDISEIYNVPTFSSEFPELKKRYLQTMAEATEFIDKKKHRIFLKELEKMK